MKTSKSFNIGDKVFAKVKGYPAWPAQVVGLSGKRYDVRFYGTGETGCLKPEDLFYYLKYKSQYVKAHKQKKYNEAVEEIEKEIAASGGTDGNNESDTTESESPQKKDGKRNSKRKRDSTNDSTPRPSKSKRSSSGLPEPVHKDEKVAEEQEKKPESAKAKVNKLEDSAIDIVDETNSTVNESTMNADDSTVNDSANHSNSSCKKEDVDSPEKGFIREDSKNKTEEKKASKVETVVKTNEEEESTDLPDVNIDNLKEISKDDEEIWEEYKNMTVIPQLYLEAIISYAGQVRENEKMFKDKKPDPTTIDEDPHSIKVVPVQVPMDKCFGIKFQPKDLSNFKNEYERALHDEKIAREILDLTKALHSGKEPEGDNRVFEMKCSLKYIHQMVHLTASKYKSEKLQFLQDETKLFNCIVNIKKSLSLERANTKEAQKALHEIYDMEISPLSLKKHPQFVDTIKRLRKYVGNVAGWKLTAKELSVFTADAAEIRALAEKVCDKFKALLNYSNDDKFFEKFSEDCVKFSELTKDLNESDLYHLCAEPFSRKAILDQIYENLSSKKLSNIQI